MTKYRTITGFVAVALLAAVATATSMRSNSLPNNGALASAGFMTAKELRIDLNMLPTEVFDDQSFVYSAKR